MAKLEIFIGYIGITPQYHTLHVPDLRKKKAFVFKPLEDEVRVIGKPTKYFGQILFNYKKINKRFVQKIKSNERK